ncbi:meiosis-specific protein ASY2-like [Arabidopsis lyrata subsp. lyrata]|uniref:meiosis-specific protein ASY2-like n=1 Tax=Arabidopsis lyrata subsp. lyrata TaxID=81972 RepID=UPI000A29D009|nr:meiosis-specific protein ASY2-like [Arabidopsis lyrata subsp. lyrata]|eukprot:XP_020867339.1 meiosis-specific protein ASY2-like [Arabidopsis lyrata subsp. lyrata]
MTSDSERPEYLSYDERRSSNDECTRPNDIAGPHYKSTCTLQSLERLKGLCQIPPGIIAEAQIADPTESPENHRVGYFCVYEIYFKGCGLTFPLPEALVRFLAALEIALPQLTPNLFRTILGIITVAAEAGYVIGVPKLNELLSVRSSSKKTGYFSAYPNANRNVISHLPNKDENWHHPWFLIKKTPASIGNLSDVLPSKWSAKPALIASTLPTEEFVKFFKSILEGETLWNSFTLDRFIEANRKLRMSPPNLLHRLPPPPSTQGMSTRALTAQRKKLSKPIAEACDENKAFLAAAIDKKDYSRTLLVDDNSSEGARSVAAYRLTPRRERHDERSPRRERSPRCDSPRPPRDDFSNEPLKNLVRRKRDKSSRSDSSPRREKSRARTDRSPRSSPPTEPMGPPRPVDMSSSAQPESEKTVRSASPKKGDSESRGASSRSKPALVPQVKSLSAMEKEGSVFRCFKTRSGSILPNFNKWRPAIRERYLLHAHHSSRAHNELNDMIEHYEGLVIGREKETDMWKKKFSALEAELSSSVGSKHDLEDKVDSLASELAQIKGELQDQYDRNYKLQDELAGVQGRLHESESTADTLNNQLIELDAKYKALAKLRDSELARSASKARKEVKGRGMELIQGAIRFMQTEKARSDLESDIKEHERNLILLDQIHEADFSEEQERTELSTNLSEKRSRLAALPTSTFNPLDCEEFFTESPPISESGLDWAEILFLGSSETEDVVPPVAPMVPEVTPEDGCTAEGGQGASSDQAPIKEASETLTAEPESEMEVDP